MDTQTSKFKLKNNKSSPCAYLNTTPWKGMGSGGIAPRIHNLGTNCRWVDNFTLRPFYLLGKSPRYPFDRRLGGTPESVWLLWRTEKAVSPAGNCTSIPLSSSLKPGHYTDWAVPAPLKCIRVCLLRNYVSYSERLPETRLVIRNFWHYLRLCLSRQISRGSTAFTASSDTELALTFALAPVKNNIQYVHCD
jgi:hypothetical protein